MGIGLIEVWKHLKKGDILRFKRQLQMHGASNRVYPKDSYIVIISVTPNRKGSIQYSSIFSYNYYKNKEKMIKGLPPDERQQTWSFDYDFFKKYFEPVNKNMLKESLNEKFTEDGDPIRDMGIGSKFAHIKEGDIVKNLEPIKVIEIKHRNAVSSYKMFTKNGRDHSPCTGIVIKAEHNYKKDNLTLYVMFFLDQSQLYIVRESILNGKYKFKIDKPQQYTFCYSTQTYEFWEKNLTIIDQ